MSRFLKLISDFNVEPLAQLLRNLPGWEADLIEVAPFGQVYQALSEVVSDEHWTKILWTQPDRVLVQFARACSLEIVDHDEVLGEVDAFADAIVRSAFGSQMLVASWVMPENLQGYGMLDWRPGLGLQHLLARMNLRLAERLAAHSHIFVMNTDRWLRATAETKPTKLWYATKVPYALRVFEQAAQNIAGALDAVEGKARRLIVLDLDNTLWGGVVGETGWQGLRLGGHDHVGEAFRDFQRELRTLSSRGIQLAIVSKNDEEVALKAISDHPEMMLRKSDFVGWRINWNDKASNILQLAKELNLGLSSIVFIDDNPAERDRVASALPDVLVPDWPKHATSYVSALRELDCFQISVLSNEDRMRKDTYIANRERQELMQTVDSADDWLRRLDTRVRVSRVSAANIARVAQLFNKTNQLNLSTRRLSEREIFDWQLPDHRSMLTISVSDHFGDMGLVGIVSVEANAASGAIVDYILSCRVMGRKVEDTLLHIATEELAQLGATTMEIRYLPTPRNRPTLEVLQKAGLTMVTADCFIIEMKDGFKQPDTVRLERVDG
jgi:FkbH-like protein